ncbi:biotin synthase [Hypnocyclicus thermotrophus]|uniref:Biotin synthase n=1 Tax=Hypnocyclicus thermotrophus TaxID=1627895 RepID=A0AA46I5A0_9FUSO|nr:biotin synthase BioB [Hypnocyclicus thermotrophus]TDT67860.1 biotin synthase [Hypnocyclicus thermotrophus]
MDLRKLIDKEITREEAIELSRLKGSKMMELFAVANEIREKYCGNELHTCTITNAKSGKCPENCKFCAQSAHHNTNIPTYDLKDEETLLNEYSKSEDYNAKKFGLVTSGRSIKKGTKEFEEIEKFIENAKKTNKKVELCCSIGLLDAEEIKILKSKGLTRIHNNIQTSPKVYDKLVSTTHNVQDRINTIKIAKQEGIEVCSGGIIGMGETFEDRIDMAFTLKELNVDAIPLNILNPIKGTPYENMQALSMDEILKTFAIFRIIHKDKVLKIGAGREGILKDFMGMAFMSGMNGMLIGGYLTVRGREVEDDFKFIENVKKMWKNK